MACFDASSLVNVRVKLECFDASSLVNLLTYLGLLQMEHRPSTIPLQHTRFWAASHAPFQLSFWALSSASVSRLQLPQGRPLLRFPWGFQLRAGRVMLAGGFLSVWPIQPHFLWRICLASGSCLARSHKSVLLILSGHRMPRIRRRQVLTKHWIFWCDALVVRHVSHPYSNTDLTLELKILSLVPVLISVDPQIFFNRTKAPLALPTLALTSWSVPPFLSTTLPRYTKIFHFLYMLSHNCNRGGDRGINFHYLRLAFIYL